MSTPSSRPRRCRHAAAAAAAAAAAVDDGNGRCVMAEKSRCAKRAPAAPTSGEGRAGMSTGERCDAVERSARMSLIMNDGRRSPHDVVTDSEGRCDVATSAADVSDRRCRGWSDTVWTAESPPLVEQSVVTSTSELRHPATSSVTWPEEDRTDMFTGAGITGSKRIQQCCRNTCVVQGRREVASKWCKSSAAAAALHRYPHRCRAVDAALSAGILFVRRKLTLRVRNRAFRAAKWRRVQNAQWRHTTSTTRHWWLATPRPFSPAASVDRRRAIAA